MHPHRKPHLQEVPPDGWPSDSELVTRVIESKAGKRRRAKRNGRYLHIEWGKLAAALCRIGTDHTTRLWLLLYLQTEMTKPGPGWVALREWLLKDAGLDGPHFTRVVARLESKGLIEAQRRPGKRALVKLMNE